jgi:hypothetical protein
MTLLGILIAWPRENADAARAIIFRSGGVVLQSLLRLPYAPLRQASTRPPDAPTTGGRNLLASAPTAGNDRGGVPGEASQPIRSTSRPVS